MNGFQKSIVVDARKKFEKLNGEDRYFIESLEQRFMDSDLTDFQNQWLNDISQKLIGAYSGIKRPRNDYQRN